LVTILMFMIQPKVFFDDEGHVKPFGLHFTEKETPVPLPVVIYGLLVLVYLLLTYVDLLVSVRSS
jgi:hypothetical protein